MDKWEILEPGCAVFWDITRERAKVRWTIITRSGCCFRPVCGAIEEEDDMRLILSAPKLLEAGIIARDILQAIAEGEYVATLKPIVDVIQRLDGLVSYITGEENEPN